MLLTINILERKKEFAVLKVLGSPNNFLQTLIIKQSLIISLSGCIIAFMIFPLFDFFIENFFPEISTKTNFLQIVYVVSIVLIISILSSLISMQKLKRIYALEAFYD